MVYQISCTVNLSTDFAIKQKAVIYAIVQCTSLQLKEYFAHTMMYWKQDCVHKMVYTCMFIKSNIIIL